MADEAHVPTLGEIWDFLVEFKEATVAGFSRVQSDFTHFGNRLQRLEDRLIRLDDRISGLEDRL